MRVLLVEDDDMLRELFARLLKRHACEVRAAADAFEALEAAACSPPDLVVTDLMMPGMDGVELIRRLRRMPGMGRMPIVMVTADPTPECAFRAQAAGAAEVVAKPVDVGELVEQFRAHCE